MGHRAVPQVRGRRGPVRWAVAARRAGPRAVRGAARRQDPGPGRADRMAGRTRRGGLLRPVPRDYRGHHHADHLPPVLDGPPGRAHLRPGQWTGTRARRPRVAAGRGKPLCRALPAPGRPLRGCVMAASPAAAGRWRTWGSVLAWGWRATPGWFSYTAALLLISAISTIVYPGGLALVIDASLVAGLYALTWAVNMLAGTAAAGLSDRTALYLSTRVAEQLNAVSTIDHLERPASLTELDLLRENLRLLSNGARQMLVTAQILVRTLGIVVILAVIYPPLALLPLCGIAPVAGERLSVWLRQRTDERLAPDRRLADELFELATSAAPAKE